MFNCVSQECKIKLFQFNNLISSWLFRSGGKYNVAITRMAIAIALWLTIRHHSNFDSDLYYKEWISLQSSLGWVPKGIIKIFDLLYSGPPSELLVKSIYITAHISIICMFIGLLIPISQVIAVLSVLFIVSLQTSYGPYWSHAYNVQLLAGLAFMFARSADVLSVDYLINKWRNNSNKEQGNIYWWPVIFAELSVALFMFGAFFQKFRAGGIYWALSDNIRNSLVISWLQYRSEPPSIVMWIVQDPLIWKTAGMLQLFAQSTSILAAFFLHRPIFRFIFGGLFFFIEIVALGHVFEFWHPFWIPLCFICVDWEYFYKLLSSFRSKKIDNYSSINTAPNICFSRRYKVSVLLFGTIFFGYYILTLLFSLGQKHLNYPFSTMGFFAETRAIKPYNEHKYFPIYTGRIDVYTSDDQTKPVEVCYREELDDYLFRKSTIKELEEIDNSMQKRLKRGIYTRSRERRCEHTLVEFKKIIYRSGFMATTPYPSKPDFVDLHMAYRAVRDDKGFRALISKLHWDTKKKQYVINIEHKGFKKPSFEILARYNMTTNPQITGIEKLPGYWENDKYFIENNKTIDRVIFSLIKVKDQELGIEETYYGPDNFRDYR
jgi:hypothetical protein